MRIVNLSAKPLAATLVLTGIFTVVAHGQDFLTNGLIAYYPFNGNAMDESGHGHIGYEDGAKICADRFGKPNSAYYFDGHSSIRSTIPEHPRQMTVSVWFMPTVGGSHACRKMIHRSSIGNNNGASQWDMCWKLGENSAMPFNVVYSQLVYDANPSAYSTQSGAVLPNVWTQAALVFDGTRQILYVNGMAASSLPRAGFNLKYVNDEFYIGCAEPDWGDDYFIGYIDDVRIFNRALLPNEIAELYSMEKVGSTSAGVAASPQNSLPPVTADKTIPPSILAAASEIAPPTNEIVELSSTTGEVRVLDSKGLLVRTNFVYLPRIQIAELSNGDLLALLENKVVYSALTSFGNIRAKTTQSEQFENQMRQIWLHGKSLEDKIQTRLVLLDEIRSYNNAVAAFIGSVRNARQSRAYANSAAQQLANLQLSSDIGEISGRETHWGRQLQSEGFRAKKQIPDASTVAQGTAIQSDLSQSLVESNEQKCEVYASRLASYGVTVPNSPPFFQVPPLSMRLEVDAERVANP